MEFLRIILGMGLVVLSLLLGYFSGGVSGIEKDSESGFSIGIYSLVIIAGLIIAIGPRWLGNWLLKFLDRMPWRK